MAVSESEDSDAGTVDADDAREADEIEAITESA